MDLLYKNIRDIDYNRRLEISRNFVRFLVEHKHFIRIDPQHRIDLAEISAYRLREIIRDQEKNKPTNKSTKQPLIVDYETELMKIRYLFNEVQKLNGQARGYALEKLFVKLMEISNILVVEPFKIIGEQLDGAIKYGGHYYLLELKWTESKAAHQEISSLYMKVEGKLDARGIFLSMNGYSTEILQSLPKGKSLKTILFDGMDFANVIYGYYTFSQLLEYALKEASLKGNIFCNHNIGK